MDEKLKIWVWLVQDQPLPSRLCHEVRRKMISPFLLSPPDIITSREIQHLLQTISQDARTHTVFPHLEDTKAWLYMQRWLEAPVNDGGRKSGQACRAISSTWGLIPMGGDGGGRIRGEVMMAQHWKSLAQVDAGHLSWHCLMEKSCTGQGQPPSRAPTMPSHRPGAAPGEWGWHDLCLQTSQNQAPQRETRTSEQPLSPSFGSSAVRGTGCFCI